MKNRFLCEIWLFFLRFLFNTYYMALIEKQNKVKSLKRHTYIFDNQPTLTLRLTPFARLGEANNPYDQYKYRLEKIQGDNDQEKAHSERNSHSKRSEAGLITVLVGSRSCFKLVMVSRVLATCC